MDLGTPLLLNSLVIFVHLSNRTNSRESIHFSGLGPSELNFKRSRIANPCGIYLGGKLSYGKSSINSYLCWTLGYTCMTPTFHPLPMTESRQWPNSTSFSIKVDLTLIFLHSCQKPSSSHHSVPSVHCEVLP